MEYQNIMTKAIEIFHDRASQYGDMQTTLERQAQIASLILNKNITPYDVAMILHACKLGRLENDRNNLDSYVDGINYFAFAGMMATEHLANIAERNSFDV